MDADTRLEDPTLSDYFALLKPRVMSLVVFTGAVGLYLAPGFADMHPVLACVAIFALALGSGAAGSFNMWYERDIDALMNRTKNRPLPRQKIIADNALGFSIFASFAALMLMYLATNLMATLLLAFAIFFYVVIYTVWLKPRTPQNIVIGGAAGAFPPLIGWAAVTGDISTFPFLLFLIIFFWTPPHFWALSLFANADYKRANIPMMTVTAGEASTKIQMLVYTLILAVICFVPWFMGMTGMLYSVSAIMLNALFILSAIFTLKHDDLIYAKRMFGHLLSFCPFSGFCH